MTTPGPSPHFPPGFDFLDPDRNVVRLPIDELAELRRTAPVWWCGQAIGKGGFNDGGYWVVTKHKDVKEVSRRNDIYHSGPNTALPQFADDMAREDIDMQSVVLLNMDGERHDRLRRIISRGFTPRAVDIDRPGKCVWYTIPSVSTVRSARYRGLSW
jgi:cholest-4-en-3-one 26-monooxygenase